MTGKTANNKNRAEEKLRQDLVRNNLNRLGNLSDKCWRKFQVFNSPFGKDNDFIIRVLIQNQKQVSENHIQQSAYTVETRR